MMYILYSLLFIMIFFALALLAIPFIKNKSGWVFVAISLFVIVFSFAIYNLSGNKVALAQWFAQGQKHYQLQMEVKELGGLDGIIARVQKKLEIDSQDAQG